MKKDDFGDRMKYYEKIEAGRKLMPLLPICARLDGKNFSKFTKNLKKPYDERLSTIMIEVTKFLVKETNATIGYTQSDEISLVWYSNTFVNSIFLNYKIQKMNSILTSLCTAKFNDLLQKNIEDKFYKNKLAFFDSRIWNVPTLEEATNVLLWRENDAIKNSISTATISYYSAKEVHKKNGIEKKKMLLDKNINWDEYPDFFKKGVFIQFKTIQKKFQKEEIVKLPLKHDAKKNKNLVFERRELKNLDLPELNKISNRKEVLFENKKIKLLK